MKLLGWVHRKFRREAAAGDPHGDLAGGGRQCSCLSQQPSLQEPHPHLQHHPRPLTRPPFNRLFREDGCCEEALRKEHALAIEELLFQGLLAIGTLGLDPSVEGLPPPQLLRLPSSIVAEKDQLEATEDNVNATDAELEKALVLESGDKNGQLSSARASYDSLSPGEMLAKSQTEEEGGGERGKKGEKRERGMAAMVSKMLKRRCSRASAAVRGGAVAAHPAGGRVGDTSTAETKFYKILKLFQKKVHPEGSVARKKHAKSSPQRNSDAGTYSGDGGGGDEAIALSTRSPKKGEPSCGFRRWAHPPSPPRHSPQCSGGSSGNREQWIKTDMDYLVLEL